MAKQFKPVEKTEAEKEIERLEEQVKRANEKGLTDTCHHEMLRRAKGGEQKQTEEQ